jgi:hypothetical protein
MWVCCRPGYHIELDGALRDMLGLHTASLSLFCYCFH